MFPLLSMMKYPSYLGYTNSSASNNAVLVTDKGSLWTNQENLYIGNSGAFNSLVISKGALVTDYGGTIGYGSSASNNTVLVTDNNSLWSNNDLWVGGAGS